MELSLLLSNQYSPLHSQSTAEARGVNYMPCIDLYCSDSTALKLVRRRIRLMALVILKIPLFSLGPDWPMVEDHTEHWHGFESSGN